MINSKRNKKLVKNIAIIFLVCVILYVIKNVFFYKNPIMEGYTSSSYKDFTGYQTDALSLKLNNNSDPDLVKSFMGFVSSYGETVEYDRSQLESEKDGNSAGPGSLESVENVLKDRLGAANYNTLKTHYKNDPNGDYYKYIKDNKPDPSTEDKAFLKGLMGKIEEIYKQIPKPEAQLKS